MQRVRRARILTCTVLGSLFAALFVYASVAPPPSTAAVPLDRVRFRAIEQEDLRSRLQDPDSVKFRRDYVSTLRRTAVLCGEINYKNAVGGYVGFQRFISGATLQVFEEAVGISAMERLWSVMCGPDQ